MAIRTFLALELDEPVRRRLLAAVDEFAVTAAKVRWVAAENLHVTLKFLGDVGDSDVPGVCQAACDAVASTVPFDFDIQAIRCMPPAGKVQIIWADVNDPTGRMAAMFAAVESALEPLGFARERRDFRPHVTLGRVKLAKNPAELRAVARRLETMQFGTQRAQRIVVYSSQLTPQGSIYAPLARGEFAGA